MELGDYVYLNGLGKGYLIIGDKTKISAFSRIVVSTSYNNLGEFIHIGNNKHHNIVKKIFDVIWVFNFLCCFYSIL